MSELETLRGPPALPGHPGTHMGDAGGLELRVALGLGI